MITFDKKKKMITFDKKKMITFDKKKINFIITKRLFLRGKKENCYVHTEH